jgi:hypothetical protein
MLNPSRMPNSILFTLNELNNVVHILFSLTLILVCFRPTVAKPGTELGRICCGISLNIHFTADKLWRDVAQTLICFIFYGIDEFSVRPAVFEETNNGIFKFNQNRAVYRTDMNWNWTLGNFQCTAHTKFHRNPLSDIDVETRARTYIIFKLWVYFMHFAQIIHKNLYRAWF